MLSNLASLSRNSSRMVFLYLRCTHNSRAVHLGMEGRTGMKGEGPELCVIMLVMKFAYDSSRANLCFQCQFCSIICIQFRIFLYKFFFSFYHFWFQCIEEFICLTDPKTKLYMFCSTKYSCMNCRP